MFKRIILLSIEGLGIGASKDANQFNDEEANTLGHLRTQVDLFIPNLNKLGIIEKEDLNFKPSAYYSTISPSSKKKDVLSTYYEMFNVASSFDFLNIYDNQIETEILQELSSQLDLPLIGNKKGSTEVILDELGKRNMEYQSIIVSYPEESTVELLAHDDQVSSEVLTKAGRVLQDLLKNAEKYVSRIKITPFTGKNKFRPKDAFIIYNRFEMNNIFKELKENDFDVISVGNLASIFNKEDFTKIIDVKTDNAKMTQIQDLLLKDNEGLIIANFEEFLNSETFENKKKALEIIDVQIPVLLSKLKHDDLLIITSNIGSDITLDKPTTRENVPLVVYNSSFINSGKIDNFQTLGTIGKTIIKNFNLHFGTIYQTDSILEVIKKN